MISLRMRIIEMPDLCTRPPSIMQCMANSQTIPRLAAILGRSLSGGRVNARITTSSLLLPTKSRSDKEGSICSHKIMLQMGLIRQSSAGIYNLLPMALRALEKLITHIDKHMQAIGAAKMAMPMLIPSALWKKSGRLEIVGQELFRLYDRAGNQNCLGPTHEEVITSLIKEELVSKKQLPLKIYQLDRKFRDEQRPRFGLLRAREFWMKDLYTFDESAEEAIQVYELVCETYEKILKELNLPVIKARADSGNVGGSLSHEYHIPCAVGENTIKFCQKCNVHCNEELLSEEGILPNCPHVTHDCSPPCLTRETKGIEVAHAFFLGTKYSDPFNVHYTNQEGSKSLVHMGCYGIGVSRLLAAAIEYGATFREDRLIWPRLMTPYLMCIVPMAMTPSDPLMEQAKQLYDLLNQFFPGEVLLEDRLHLTLGARRRDLENRGYPVGIIVGSKVPQEKVELQVLEEGSLNSRHEVIRISELVNTLQTYFREHC